MNDSVVLQKMDLPRKEIEHHQASNALVGKDILELLSISMYVDPLVMYREYVQNSVDSIDEASERKLLDSNDKGKVSIKLSQKDRCVIVRDNGTGIAKKDFERLMVSFGASPKRGNSARGFRGVGRLSGLAFCQNLIFRTKSKAENVISEICWDGRKFRKLLQDNQTVTSLEELVSEVATIATYEAKNSSGHFFEVELQKIVRTKNDVLLNENVVTNYLAQTCPVPYSEQFSLKEELETFLLENGIYSGYALFLSSDYVDEKQIFRPYEDNFSISENVIDSISGVQKFSLDSVHEGVSAIGWILTHNYKGVIPASSNIRGIRTRKGNIQIGNDALFVDVFPEARFNSWSIGEVHILDSKVIPNGRRDNFEQNIHWMGVQGQFAPYAKGIARTCRRNSAERNLMKAFFGMEDRALQGIALIQQGALTKKSLKETSTIVSELLSSMEALCEKEILSKNNTNELSKRVNKVRKKVAGAMGQPVKYVSLLDSLSPAKRRNYQEIFDLIYSCSANQVVAKGLLDKILAKLEAKQSRN